MTEKQFLLAYDRKRTSTLTLDSEPGAHTGNTRQYIPGYSDSNIVYLDTVSGNDANSGASEVLAKLTYASAATAAGTTKKIRVINNGAALSTNITKPTEMKRGVSGTIAPATSALATWTQASTPSFGATDVLCVAANDMGRIVAGASAGKIAYSDDGGDTWTQGTGLAASAINDVIYDRYYEKWYAASSRSVLISSDGAAWTSYTLPAIGVFNTVVSNQQGAVHILGVSAQVFVSNDGESFVESGYDNITLDSTKEWGKAIYNESESRYVAGLASSSGTVHTLYYSADAITWTACTAPAFVGSLNAGIYAAATGVTVFVAGGGDALVSSNGITFTAHSSGVGTPYGVSYSPAHSKFVTVGASGNGTFSADYTAGNTSFASSFGSTTIYDCAYDKKSGRLIAVGFSGKIARSNAVAANVQASIAGFTITECGFSTGISLYSCTSNELTATNPISVYCCRATSAEIDADEITIFGSLFNRDVALRCTPATQNAIDCNLDTVGGTWYIYNASATGFERIRDCLVTGGVIANFNVAVSGRANIQGDSENMLPDAEVTLGDDPKFVDTTDYKLQFQTNGYARNSLAAGRSAIYFNSAGSPRDIGAWSYVESAVSYFFAKSAVLYKGEITHEIEETVSEQQGDSGVVSVYGNANRIKEIITISYGDTREVDRAPFEYIRLLKDKGVKLILDAEWESNAGTVTVNGNQAAWVEFLTVDSCIYYNGLWVTVSGKRYWIMRASPSNTAATKLILDRPLEDAVSDNDVLTTNYPPGVGEYQFAGLARLQLKRKAPDGLKGWQTGLQLRFVRKYQ